MSTVVYSPFVSESSREEDLIQLRAEFEASSSSSPCTLMALLNRVATKHPHKSIQLFDNGLDAPSTTITYGQLYTQAQINAKKLTHLGIVAPGQTVVVYSETHAPNIIWTWSLIAAAAVPAVLSPLSNDEKTLAGQLENINNLFGNPLLLTTKDLVPRFQSQAGLRVQAVEEIDAFHNESIALDSIHLATPLVDGLAIILFTSGSTGHSKGVEFTHSQLIDSVIAKEQMHKVDENTTFMAWNSFDHSANFCELHLNAINACANQIMIPPSSVVMRPEVFYEVLSEFKIGYSFAPNFFLSASTKAIQANGSQNKLDLSNLRTVMVGGEANRTDVIANANEFVRANGGIGNPIKAAYGLSETCSACFYNLNGTEADQAQGLLFASAGQPLPGLEIRIADEELKPLSYNTQGRIQLRGNIIMKRYYNNPQATSDCITSDGWFDTGDMGYQDNAGSLIISGRSKEILILNGNNYSSFELEHTVYTGVPSGISSSYLACFSTWDPAIESEGVVILFNPTDDIFEDKTKVREVISQISKVCVAFCSKYPLAVIPLPKAEMPKSTIGKLSRQKLKKFYESGAFEQYVLKEETTISHKLLWSERQNVIAGILAEQTGRSLDTFGADSPIMSTGIDSLAYLRIKHLIQKRLNLPFQIPLPILLRSDNIEDLEDAISKLETQQGTDGNSRYDPIVTLQKGGSKVPIVLFHPGGGEFLNWLNLVPYLPDRPVYAIRARGLQSGETRFKDFAEMLDCYEAGIRRVQPRGPYAFFGLCFGGLLSFEMGRRFETAGDQVAFCGGIDNAPKLDLINPSKSFKRFLLQLIAFHGLFSLDEATRMENEDYKDVDEAPELFVERVLAGFRDQAQKLDLDTEKIHQWMNVLLGAIETVNTYEPKGRIDSYDVFVAGEPPNDMMTYDHWKNLLKGWDNHCYSSGYYHVTGNHFNTLNPPYIDSLQQQLNIALEYRQC